MAKIYSYAYFLGILSYALPKIDISCSALFEALCLNKRKTRNAEDLSKIANDILQNSKTNCQPGRCYKLVIDCADYKLDYILQSRGAPVITSAKNVG